MSYEQRFEWRNSNGQEYLYIQGGNRFELGAAFGQGAARNIGTARGMYARKIDAAGASIAVKMQIAEWIRQYISFIPEEDMEEIRGIKAGYESECQEKISVEEIALQSIGIDLANQLEARTTADVSLEGCTNFGVINPDGTTAHGQNYDSSPAAAVTDVFVHHHLKGAPDVFLYRPGGSLGMALGMNESGVAMTVSVVKTKIAAPVMTPRSVLVRRALLADSSLQAIRAMTDSKGRTPFCYNLIASDSKTVTGAQMIPTEQRIVQVKRTLVQSNQYDYVDWMPHLKKPSYSKKRQLQAEDLIDKILARYGKITDEDLLEILREEPVICRTKVGDGIGTTVLFMTRKSFGRGNAVSNPVGKIPFSC